MKFTFGSKTIARLKDAEEQISPFSKEVLQLIGLVGLTVFAVYYAPSMVANLLVLAVLVQFFLSKKDYFWLAYFLVIYFTPLGFFNEFSGDATHRLPLFKLGPGVAFATQQFFLLAALLKAIYKRRKYKYTIQNAFFILLAYFGVLIIAAIVEHQSGFDLIVDEVKAMLAFSLLFTLPMLLRTTEDVEKLLYLLFPFVILVFLGGIYYIVSGAQYLYHVVNPSQYLIEVAYQAESSDFSGRFIPHGGQFNNVFLGFVTSLFLIVLRGRHSIYLFLVAISGYLVIIIGSYRSWFVIFTLIFFGYILVAQNRARNLLLFAVISILMIVVISQTNYGSAALAGAWERTATVFELGQKGSASTDQLQSKAENRLPEQLKWIKESPVFGWGFTEREGDGDVGNFALLVDVGFMGFFLFVFLWYSYIKMIIAARMNLPKNSRFRPALNIFLFGFLGLLLSHFTTNRIFGIASQGVLLSLYFFFTDFYIKVAFKEEAAQKEEMESLPIETESEDETAPKETKEWKPWLHWWF
jgi:hypothetical protein